VLGQELALNYILADDINNEKKPVTLSLQDNVSAKKLFTLTEDILVQRGYVIRFDDGIFYIHKDTARGKKGDVLYGYGKYADDVPETSLDIIQMIPFDYGMQTSAGNSLRQLLGLTVYPVQARNSLIIKGKRKDIVRALEFIQLIDTPTLKDRHIGIYQSVFLATDELITKLSTLLKQEGLSLVKISTSTALSVVELDKQGELIFFANNIAVIERAVFWAKHLDKPILTAEKQYFIYKPKFSRAVDMGDSLQLLIGEGGGLGSSTSAASENSSRPSVSSASSKNMKMVVDERANSIIFFAAGDAYQQLLPLIKRLDVLPKQVLLEVMIAEVKLTDGFKAGVQFDLTNKGVANVTGGFDLANGSSGLSYILSGMEGSISANLLQTNNNVNVLSKPTLLVRDGVNATINVGDDIPTVGEIVSDPVNGSRSSVVYRNTGVELAVTPTINGRGVVTMQISQSISNSSPGNDAVAGSPIFSQRSIKTEVIAESGQTIVLGGLITDNNSANDTSVPFFSSLPLIGNLFNSTNESKDKTELIVLVTPKIIESSDEWDEIKSKLSNNFDFLDINTTK
jgi:general secretion pathway protein D